MADNTEVKLSPDREEAGRVILQQLDRFGFDASAAAWLHDISSGAWRYVLVTPMLRSRGPRWIYDRLLRVFRAHPLPKGYSPLDIVVVDPEMERTWITGPDLALDDTRRGIVPTVIKYRLNAGGLTEGSGMIFYMRRRPLIITRRRGDSSAVFDRKVSALAA